MVDARSLLPERNTHATHQVSSNGEDSEVTQPTPEEIGTNARVSTNLLSPTSVENLPTVDRTSARGNLVSWTMKGGLAVLDQGLVTGSNFVVNILLARWLPPEAYGAYAVAYAGFLLLVMLYQSLFLLPQAVFGAAVYRASLRGYLKALLRLHLGASVLMFLVLAASAGVALKLGQPGGLPGALAGLALAAPCILLFWLARRTSYLEFSPAPATGGSLFYCAATLSGLYVANRLHLLSPMWAFLIMGLGALGGSAVLFIYMKLRLPLTLGAPSLQETWRRHWSYGRWTVASAALNWIPFNIFYPLLSSFSGMAQAGELKALMNFCVPVLQGYGALHPLVLPYIVRVHKREGWAGTRAVTWRITLLCVSGALAFWLPLVLFKGTAFRLLYSGRYTEVASLLPVVALASVSWSAYYGIGAALLAMEYPASVFVATLVSSCVSTMIGIPAAKLLGVRGAVWAIALSEMLAMVMAWVLLRRKVRRAADSVPTHAGAVSEPIV